MKKLSDLGISPPPWNIKYFEFPVEYGCGRTVGGIVPRNGGPRIDLNMGIADARLIAAAPKLYNKAFKLITAFDGHAMTPGHVEALRAALADAAGETANY